jgi:aryl-alcohol dehydrogenase-like predicted oxidoreductase
MKTSVLGKGGPIVSALGLGCMRMSSFSGSQPSTYSEEFRESVATIEAALDVGINFINTGDFYGQGHNEAVVARAIEHRREQAFLSVKFGVLRDPSGKFLGLDVRPNSVKNFAAYSLQRLDVDVIDLYQPGRIDPTVPIEDTIGAIAELIHEGKVRYLGLSEVNAQQLRQAHSVYPVTALEIEYSLATRMIEPEILPTARELGISIIAYNVFGQGLLTGTVDAELRSEDSRANLPRFQKENLAKNLETVSVLDSIAAAKGCTPAQIAIAWTISRGDDIVALLGMSRRSHLPENLAALDLVLSADERSKLDRTFALGAIVGDRGPSHVKHLSPQ